MQSTESRADLAASRTNLGGVVSKETLAHVDDGFDRRSRSGFVHNSPAGISLGIRKPDNTPYQTSCLCPATLAAGLKGSSRLVVADMVRRGVKVVGQGALVALTASVRRCREARVSGLRMAGRDRSGYSMCSQRRCCHKHQLRAPSSSPAAPWYAVIKRACLRTLADCGSRVPSRRVNCLPTHRRDG